MDVNTIEIYYMLSCTYFDSLLGAPFNVTIDGVTQYFSGDTLEMNCSSQGSSELQYDWSRNTSSGQNVFSTNITTVGNFIIIKNVTVDDGGTYTCTVTNGGGSSSYNIHITIIGKNHIMHNAYKIYVCIN